MTNIPGFLSNQPMRGDMPSRGAGGRNFGSNSGKRKSGDSNGWFEFKEIMNGLMDRKKDLIQSTADTVATYAIKLNNSGTTDVKSITKNMLNGLDGFTDAEKAEILSIAIAKIVANI